MTSSPPELISFLTGRVGRFSNLDATLVVDPQIIVSLNMPYMDNHAFRLLMEEELGELDPDKSPELVAALQGRPLLECFVQPGGRDPKAENIHNLPGATPKIRKAAGAITPCRSPPTSIGRATSTAWSTTSRCR
jgi:hypothetical protein